LRRHNARYCPATHHLVAPSFDVTGKGIANPVGALWTGALMLEHLGEKDAAQRLMQAVERVTASGIHTPDLGGKATTREVTAAVCDAI